ncbi:hypothetical protein C9Y79_22095, partial [Escherichia coli]
KTSIFSHPVYLFLREFSLQDFRGGSMSIGNLSAYSNSSDSDQTVQAVRLRLSGLWRTTTGSGYPSR